MLEKVEHIIVLEKAGKMSSYNISPLFIAIETEALQVVGCI